MVSGAARRKICYTVHKQAGASRKHPPVSHNETADVVSDISRGVRNNDKKRWKSACFTEMDRGAFTVKKMLKVEKEVLNFYKHC